MRFSFILFLLLIGFIGFFSLQSFNNKSWKNKVDEDLLLEAQTEENLDFIVVMKDQKVINTDHLKTKEAKGWYVFNALTQHAQKSQKEIIAWLENKNIKYKSYHIVNMLHVEAPRIMLKFIAKRADVKQINANPTVHEDFADAKPMVGQREVNLIEWGISKIKADSVWLLGYQGTGIVVGGQDTGYDWTHPAIKNQYRGWDGTTADHNYNWHDAIHSIDAGNTGSNPCGLDSAVPCDDNNHGTHTMGTMVGDDGAGNQIGVAPGAKWIGCRNMERGDGTPVTYIECFEWFMAPTDLNDMNADPSKAPDVINNSWGCPPSEGCNLANFSVMETALNNLKNSGVMVVVSAGNGGSACSTVDDPAAIYEESFSVGAMDISDNIAGFSSRGPVTVDGSNRMKPNVAAPGVNVRSCIPGGGYANYSGTSMAGPHVAGAVALILDKHPSLIGDPNGIEDLLEMTATPFTTAQGCGTDNNTSVPNNVFGYGEINALAAVNETLVLPLDWLSFEGENNKTFNTLKWVVTSQENVDAYIIERSENGETFKYLGEVEAQDGQQLLTYNFEDAHIQNKSWYYRLKTLEQDGTNNYSKVIYIENKSEYNYQIYPNPTLDNITIRLPQYTANLHILCYNSIGQIQHVETHQNDEFMNIKFDRNTPKGIYWLIVKQGRETIITEKVVFR